MEFKLPDIGEGIHEGEITKWLVKEGDTLQPDQPMVEVMTDKATVEIPSPVGGVVQKLNAKEGETVEVGKVLIVIQEKGQAAAAKAPEAPKAEAPRQEAPKRETPRQEAPRAEAPRAASVSEEPLPFDILATPATRKLARDLKVDLRQVRGTGTAGRVTKMDVQMAYEGHVAATPRSSHPVSTQVASIPASPPAVHKSQQVVVGTVERIPLKGIRRKISEAMAVSKRTAAHFTYVEEADFSEIVKLRAEYKEEAKNRNIKLTYLPFIIKGLIPALKEFPYLNASLDDAAQEILLKGDYNIGIATDTPNGLMVPVVKHADRKSIWELAIEIEEITDRAKNGKSTIDDLKGGTYTLTNAGSIGGVFATPVINYPEVAILGVNAIRKRPMVVNDQIVIRDMMFLSMSVDHRVVDGADAARFMNRLIYFLSEPKRLVFA
jgi:pyruvate dehydrogenase E2 component (dihydrolipoamide acetyltransferase)